MDPVLRDTQETLKSAMVSDIKNHKDFHDSSVSSDINECAQNSTICSHICVNTRGDYFCSCFDGYQLIEGTNQCTGTVAILAKNITVAIGNFFFTVDVNECEEVNDCQQLCKNTEGSYTCSCREGFTLNTDNITCDGNDVHC